MYVLAPSGFTDWTWAKEVRKVAAPDDFGAADNTAMVSQTLKSGLNSCVHHACMLRVHSCQALSVLAWPAELGYSVALKYACPSQTKHSHSYRSVRSAGTYLQRKGVPAVSASHLPSQDFKGE